MKWLAIVLAMFVGSASAQEQITVPVGGNSIVRLTRQPTTVIVPNESVARVELGGSPQTLIVYGRGAGTTTITAQDNTGTVFYTAVVTVGDCGFERIVTIVNKVGKDERKDKKGIESSVRNVDLNDQHSMRCNRCRCWFFTPRNRPIDEDEVPPTGQPQ